MKAVVFGGIGKVSLRNRSRTKVTETIGRHHSHYIQRDMRHGPAFHSWNRARHERGPNPRA